MKKFRIFIAILVTILIACCFISAKPKSFFNFVNAETIDLSHTVNFYGADNQTIIYSLDVPDGKSLNNFNSLYINSNSDYSNGFNGYSVSKGSGVSYTSSFNEFSGINYSISSVSSTWFNVSFADFTASNNEFYVVLNLSNPSYVQQIYCSYLLDGVVTYPSSQILVNSGNFYIRRFYDIPVGVVIRYGYQFRTDISNYDVTVNYSFSTYNADYLYNYFSLNYVNQLYENSVGSVGFSFKWSQFSYNLPFDFNLPITKNVDLYAFFPQVTFFAEDRTTPLLVVPNWEVGTNLYNFNNGVYNFDYLKILYFQNQNTYENIDDFDLLFTNDYYEYSQYFNSNYIVSGSVNLYPKLLKVNYKQPQDYELTGGDDIFASTGQNLLNSINQDAISFNPVYFAFGANIEAQTGYIILDKIINGFSLGDNFSVYNDNLGNVWYFNTFVSSYGDNFQYLFYLYDYQINNFNFVVPVFDYDKMIFNYNNGYKLFGDATLINYNLVGSFEFEFDINYNMQFYYADYMGVSLNITNYYKPVGGGVQIRFLDKQDRIFVEDFDDVYSEYLLKTPYLKNSLINSVNFTIGLRAAMSQGFNNTSTYTSKNDAFSYLNGLSININYNDMKLYFYNVESSSNSSAIIPTTSDGLYKEKEHWYDFTTDLYNFVIYICFDAPFISNITQLLYVIISLIKKLFDLIIALFTTSNSTIFIAIFFGFFLLKMILNKVIGGKE